MAECNTNGCSLFIGKFRLDNNLWGAPAASGSIFVTNNIVGFSWNNNQRGYNYPEIIVGRNRNESNTTWPEAFPQTGMLWNQVKSCTATISYKFTQVPSSTNNWWDLGFDNYWMGNNTSSGTTNKKYNCMILIHVSSSGLGRVLKDNLSDGYNTWTYTCETGKAWPKYNMILKNRDKIPNQPVLNQLYTIKIDIKALMDSIKGLPYNIQCSQVGTGDISNLFFPGLEFGAENCGCGGTSVGRIEISQFDIEVNGHTASLGGTPSIHTLTSISPANATIQINNTQQFTALDQNNIPITSGISWLNTGVGSIDSNGLYSSGIAGTGISTIHAVQGSIDKIAQVTVTNIQTKKFNVFDIIGSANDSINDITNKKGVITMQDDQGIFTKDQACTEVCNRLGRI